MQNKYKIPKDVRGVLINIIKGYDRRAVEIKEREAEICSVGGGRYETYTVSTGHGTEERRAFTPGGKGGTSSPVENQYNELAYYHEHDDDFIANKTIDEVLAALPLEKYENSEKIREQIFISCKKYKEYPFRNTGIYEISEETFYQLRNLFLYNLEKRISFFKNTS